MRDNLWALGIAATCNAHGASEPGKRAKWTKTHSEQLAGADIVVLNDNDAAGYEHADATAKLSLGVAKRVRRLDLAQHWPEMPKGGDVSDWLAAGHTGEELEALIEARRTMQQAPSSRRPSRRATVVMAPTPRSSGSPSCRWLNTSTQRKDAADAARRPRLRSSTAWSQAEREKLGLVEDDGKQGRAISLPEPEPWPTPIDGAALLDGIADAIGRYVIMSDHARFAAALWVVHTFLLDCFGISPRLAVRSPMKRCGKTTLLDVFRAWCCGRCRPPA